jgi:CheY-like chemotaxis protein
MTVDPHQLKTATFKTPEKLWNDFVRVAEQNGSTASDVLGACMEQYLAGVRAETAIDAPVTTAEMSMLPKSPSIEPAPRANQDPDLTGIHVLVLDDEDNIRTSIRNILEHYGATVTAIASASIALQTLQANPQAYNVLLSDIGMPEQDGWSFIRQVRALSAEAGGTIPAAALTTYASPREIRIARQLGFQVHIAKPIDINLLAATVGALARDRDR